MMSISMFSAVWYHRRQVSNVRVLTGLAASGKICVWGAKGSAIIGNTRDGGYHCPEFGIKWPKFMRGSCYYTWFMGTWYMGVCTQSGAESSSINPKNETIFGRIMVLRWPGLNE